jgi:prophage regulatory protein
MTRAELLGGTASPEKALSPSAQERKRRREKRRQSGHETIAPWLDIPGARMPVAAEPPELIERPHESPPVRGPPLPRFMRRKQVLEVTTLSNSELYALVAEGRFPKPLKLTGTTANHESGGVTVWVESEVAAWMSARMASRDTNQSS